MWRDNAYRTSLMRLFFGSNVWRVSRNIPELRDYGEDDRTLFFIAAMTCR